MNKVILFACFSTVILIIVAGCPKPMPLEPPPEGCFIEVRNYSCNGFNIGERIFDEGGVEAFKIKYLSGDLRISGLLAKPKNIQGKAPLIVFNHGGVNGIRQSHAEWIKRLAEEGYVVMASTYRGEQDFTGGSEGSIEVAYGETTDVLNLLECGKTLDYVDSERIGIIGFSHGAGITVQAIELNNQITTAVEFYGLTNLFNHYERYVSGQISGAEGDVRIEVFEEFRRLDEGNRNLELKKRNAIDCVENINTPLLIIHGRADRNIPVEEGFELANELEKYGKIYEIQTYEGAEHGFNFKPGGATEASWIRTKNWFEKYLK